MRKFKNWLFFFFLMELELELYLGESIRLKFLNMILDMWIVLFDINNL